MSDRRDEERALEALSLEVSDGREPDWLALTDAAPTGDDRKVIEDLRSLARIGRYHRERREEVELSASETGASGSSIPEGTVWGHLEILEAIGRGSFGEVYRARDTRLNREVALKLHASAWGDRDGPPDRWREGELLAGVRHPNLVVVHGAGEYDGRSGLWMELISGLTLEEVVTRQGPLSGREAILVGIDLCGALSAIHAAGLLHRDIKAQNVMRERGGRVVLMDLGAGTGDGPESGCTSTGTPLYMAPELLAGGAASVSSDIYSLGVLLYRLTSGVYPVEASSMEDLRRKHAAGVQRPLRDARPDLPFELIAVIERSMAPRPEGRFASAGEMERALASALGFIAARSGAEASPARVEPPSGRSPGRFGEIRWFGLRPRTASGIGAGVLLLALVGMISHRSGWIGQASYTVEGTLYRDSPRGTELLLPGAAVAPGDRLYLEFEASRDLHLYVLAEDDRGESYLLFPLSGSSSANPLRGGTRHRIPPEIDGRRYDWGVSSAGASEHILLVASPRALTDFEQALARLPAPRRAGEPPALPLDREALRGLRGIGLLMESAPAGSSAEARFAFALARRLGQGAERQRGIWVRQIDLANAEL